MIIDLSVQLELEKVMIDCAVFILQLNRTPFSEFNTALIISENNTLKMREKGIFK